ncbi:MAG: hypothetical protein IT580_06070 [Verrucomicrobiales bacterium]|nr:hypothetical protein [Verrucomicrobiales bacterium]
MAAGRWSFQRRGRDIVQRVAFLLLSLLGLLLFASTPRAQGGLPDPWRFVTPLPQGNDGLSAWAAGPDQLYVGGHGGQVWLWNGSQWTNLAAPTQKTVFGLHGLSASHVFAVGGDPYTDVITNRCLILEWNNGRWIEHQPPTFSGYTYPLNSVHALSAQDVWATQDGGTFLVHYDGHSWEFVPVPLSVEGSFKAVTSSGPDHLYVAGTHGQILHRDHGVWKLEQKLETGNMSFNIISSLWAHSPDHVFAAGNWTQFYRRRSDGTWETLPVNASQPFGFGFTCVWGRSPTEVYLMDIESVFRFDGVHPAERTSFQARMRRQWLAGCGAGDRLYGVGPGGVAHEYLLTETSGILSPLTAGGHADLPLSLRGAAPCGTNGVVVFGANFGQPGASPLWYVDGPIPHPFPSLPPGTAANVTVRAASATSLRDITVAWENPEEFGRGVHHWNGTQWTSRGGAEGTVAFWRSPTGRLYAAAPYRIQRLEDTGTWTDLFVMPQDQAASLIQALWGRSDQELFAGTGDGRILRYNGTTWSPESTPGAKVIRALAGTPTETYALGEHGTAWRRTISGWQPLTGITATAEEHFTAATTLGDAVYAAQSTPGQFTGGGLGRIWKLQGSTATRVVQGLSQSLEALVTTGSGHLLGLAARDFIVTTAPADPQTAWTRLDLASTSWQPLGAAHLAVRPPTPSVGRPVVVARQIPVPLPFGPVADDLPVSPDHWLVLKDRFYAGFGVPPLEVRLNLDPNRLDLGPDGDLARLSLYASSPTMVEVPSTWHALDHTLSTTGASDFGLWTVGLATLTEPPRLILARGTPATLGLDLTWPASATNFVLETTRTLETASTWTEVTSAPSLSGDTLRLSVEPTATPAFFRLRSKSP